MSIVYSVYPSSACPREVIFQSLKSAKAYVKSQNLKDYILRKHWVVKPTLDNLITIVQTQGQCWSSKNEVIEKTGCYNV